MLRVDLYAPGPRIVSKLVPWSVAIRLTELGWATRGGEIRFTVPPEHYYRARSLLRAWGYL